MKSNIKYLAIAIAAVIVFYLGYDLLKPYLYPCESIFQQTATQIGGNVETIQAKGALFIGAQKIQELTERSQMLALNLKTCCTLSDQAILSSEEFLSCKGNAGQYKEQLESIVTYIEEAEKAQEKNNTQVVTQNIQKINQTITQLENESAAISKKVSNANSGPDPIDDTSNDNNGNVSATITESEPNNTILESQSIQIGTTIPAEISSNDDVDYYSFDYTGNLRDKVEIKFANRSVTLAPELDVYDQNKAQMFRRYNTTSGADISARFTVEPDQKYYVAISSSMGNEGQYQLDISNALELFDQYEMNDDTFNATTIQLDETVSASLLDQNDIDWYRIDDLSADTVKITFENRSTDLKPELNAYNENKSEIYSRYNTTTGANLNFDLDTDPGETYYFSLHSFSGSVNASNYRFVVSATSN